ncbi:hypothetical protein bthur0005_57370 [Bacillus thuringiensis serovar pakistani str. T13001]|nr:hypothetical protein bthur0005_57370 [Bacillus thuringiensis serovar pakistani str. T13001]
MCIFLNIPKNDVVLNPPNRFVLIEFASQSVPKYVEKMLYTGQGHYSYYHSP